jgi:hypothetical protein
MTVSLSSPEVSFVAAFEGPAVDAGRMNAKDLAPSLFATAELVEAAAAVVYGRPDAVTIQITAEFRRGSFEFHLIAAVAAAVGQQLWQNLSVADLEVLLRYIGLRPGEGNTLFSLLRQIGGRKIQRVEPRPDGRVTITATGDNATIVINNVNVNVAKLVTDEGVREAVPHVVAPLARPGIDVFRAGEREEPSLIVTKEDLPLLQARPVEVELADGTAQTALELLSPNFVEGNKWKVSQGGEPFWVQILDEAFLASVDKGERGFHKGDYLIVVLRTQTFATPDGLRADRAVLKVIEHRHRVRQLGLL